VLTVDDGGAPGDGVTSSGITPKLSADQSQKHSHPPRSTINNYVLLATVNQGPLVPRFHHPIVSEENRVRPMYTSDIENWEHWSLLEHRQIGVGKSPMLCCQK